MELNSRRWMVCVTSWLLLSACINSPTRHQVESMRLARQADLNYQNGRFDIAGKQYQTLVESNPGFALGHVRLGVIAYHEGNSPAALSHFESALNTDPQNEQARYNLAMLHLNEATALLDDYANHCVSGANRDHVLVLLSELKAFGAKQ